MTPEQAWDKRYAPLKFANAAKHIQQDWLAAWTIAAEVCAAEEREKCARQCKEWARICEFSKRHGAKVGALECERIIRESIT